MGRVAAPYAIRGWIKVQPFTEYLDSLLDYPVWRLGKKTGWQEYRVLDARIHSNSLIAQLEGVNDRSQAEALQGLEIAVARDELPEAEEGEYYWDDLIGLDVVNLDGVNLGKVTGLLETGAHDVLEVEGERPRLIPFTEPIVVEVDLKAGRIKVDWGADY
ncbi:16S rRNA processing protein RimM [Sulfuritortus calidifontis]|uniref:Ribosome maturation factor RimM n=1 Tax=Sulfuritortus calidifontis TaxID=1914471 RepID=A0A4R3K0V0_9PROT|nr:ribosome maturation factor RimM [Sulfuritortus calidifontis]TCS74002.1 16S rRNA processing protein RimM [Sulfuritortus calidifontis]